MRIAFTALAGSILATALAGCGSSSPTRPPAPTPTPAPVTILVSEGSEGGLEERFLLSVPFHTTALGSIRATVDWTFPESIIYVYISRDTCTLEEFNGGTCQIVAASQTSTPKPRVLTVNGAAAGAYTLYIGNFAGETEAVSWQVHLTTTASASAAEPVPAVVGGWRR